MQEIEAFYAHVAVRGSNRAPLFARNGLHSATCRPLERALNILKLVLIHTNHAIY